MTLDPTLATAPVPDVRTVELTGLTNAEFFERYAAPGRVGLVGGPGILERIISRAQKRQTKGGQHSAWAHAFVFQGRRADGQHWVLESDLDVHRERAQLGVQENRVSKYHDDAMYDTLAVLDFALPEPSVQKVLAGGLDLLADRTQYSVREVVGLYFKLKNPAARQGRNPLSRERAYFCSAFVQHLYLGVGIDFVDEVDTKLTTPEDIVQTRVPHTKYILRRPRMK